MHIIYFVIFLTIGYSHTSHSAATFYSAGDRDTTADEACAHKAFDAWNGICETLEKRIVQYRFDPWFNLNTARPKKMIRAFNRTDQKEVLDNFLISMKEQREALKEAIPDHIKQKGLENWYESLNRLGHATFFGAEWLVNLPYIERQVKQQATKTARTVFQPNQFGYRLKRSLRKEIKIICTKNRGQFCQQLSFTTDVANLPKTREEFQKAKNEIVQATKNSIREAISVCQAQIDTVVLNNQGKNIAEAIALRVERERILSDTKVIDEFLADYNQAKVAARNQFIEQLNNQSLSIAKEASSNETSIKNLTQNYLEQLNLIDNRFHLFSELALHDEKVRRELSHTNFNEATQKFFVRNQKQLNISSCNQMKKKILSSLLDGLRQWQYAQRQQLLALSLNTKDGILLFETRYADYLKSSQSLGKTYQLFLETGGITNPDWDLHLDMYKSHIAALIRQEINFLKYKLAKYDDQKITNLLENLIYQLDTQQGKFNDSFEDFKATIFAALAHSSSEQHGTILSDFVGTHFPIFLKEYIKTTSKAADFFDRTLMDINATFAAINNFKDFPVNDLRGALVTIFCENKSSTLDIYENYIQLGKINNLTLVKNIKNIDSVRHAIYQQEYEVLMQLMTNLDEAIQGISVDTINALSMPLNQLIAMNRFVYDINRLYSSCPTNNFKNLLIALVGNENHQSLFGARKDYKDLARSLRKPILFTEKPALIDTQENQEYINEPVLLQQKYEYAGLENVGNTCFANSCLQALARMKVWTGQELLYSPTEVSPNISNFRHTTQRLVDRIRRADAEVNTMLNPFFKMAYQVLPNFSEEQFGFQHDAQEFWSDLLNMLGIDDHDFLLPIKFQSSNIIKNKRDDDNGESTELAPMHALILALGNKKTITLQEALANWLKPVPYNREGVGTMFTQTLLHHPPHIMTIVVNRFDAHNQKLKTSVDAGEITIPFYNYKDFGGLRIVKNIPYKLVGGIYHNGATTRRGHYYFIDHRSGLVYDDNSIYPISVLDKKAISKQSYLLFFERVKQ